MSTHHTRRASLASRVRRLERELAALKAAPPVYVPLPYAVPQPSMYWQPWQIPVYPANPTPIIISSGPHTVISDTTTTVTNANPVVAYNIHD